MASFECPLCKSAYLTKQSLNYHVRTSHQGQPLKKRRKPNKRVDPFPCPYDDCRYSYNSKTRLENHLVLHHSVEPVVKKTSHKSLDRRKEETPYPCPHPDCQSGYFYKKRLQGHLTLCHPQVEPEPEPEPEYYLPNWPVFTSEEFGDL